MLKIFIFSISAFFLYFADFGETIKCYHCYDSYGRTPEAGSIDAQKNYSSTFVRCDKNKAKWNSWDCPKQWPNCVYMSASVGDHLEVIRSCAEKNFCANYVPPKNVTLESCVECNTTLCNDYPPPTPPTPPIGPGPLFTFNININLNMKKIPKGSDHIDEL